VKDARLFEVLPFARSCAFNRLWRFSKGDFKRSEIDIMRLKRDHEPHSHEYSYFGWTPWNYGTPGGLHGASRPFPGFEVSYPTQSLEKRADPVNM
jgi:hypothetical protein